MGLALASISRALVASAHSLLTVRGEGSATKESQTREMAHGERGRAKRKGKDPCTLSDENLDELKCIIAKNECGALHNFKK